MCVENGLGDGAGLEQGEAQQHCVMAHVLLDRFDIISGPDAVDRERMAAVMESMMLQSRVSQRFLESLPDRRLGKMASIWMREDQVGKLPFIPKSTGISFFLCLLFSVLLQHLQNIRRWIDFSRLSIF